MSVGNEYQLLQFAELPCEIVAKNDVSGLIQSIEQIGPGCSEFIYLLRLRNAEKNK